MRCGVGLGMVCLGEVGRLYGGVWWVGLGDMVCGGVGAASKAYSSGSGVLWCGGVGWAWLVE